MDKEDIKSLAIFLFVSAMIIAIICVLIGGLNNMLNKSQCEQLQELSPDYEFAVLKNSGCSVKIGGLWIDVDNLTNLDMR